MTNVSPLIPLLFLLLGAGVLLVSLLTPSLSFPAVISLGAAALAAIAFLIMGWRLPASATLSTWAPAALFSVGLMLKVDFLNWLFGWGMLGVTLATFLTGLARPGGRRTILRAAILLLTFAALAALFADNLPTRIMAWAGLDLIYFLTLILLARGEGLEPQAVLNLSFNSAGTLCAVAAALLISRTSHTLALREAALSPQSTLLITLAAMFRLGLFPLHLGLPTETTVRQGLGTVLRLIPAAVALEMMGRLALFGYAEAARPWLTLFGVGAALVGAAQLWNAADARSGVTYVVIAQSGVALLAGLFGGPAALTAQALALLWGGAIIFLASGHDESQPWASALPLAGAAAMLGAPLTAGFVGAAGLYSGLWREGQWPALAGLIIAQALFTAGCLRAVFWPGQPLEGAAHERTGYWAGLILPALGLSLVGLFSGPLAAAMGAPSAGPFGFVSLASLGPLAVVIGVAAGGYGLWRFDDRARARAEATSEALLSILRLRWLYTAVWNVFRGAGGLTLTLAEVLEGEGALLWALVAGLLLWLALR